ncbi:MAG: protein kinase domain-containing protein [Oscillochloridaceae bacterium umkhey_bin13]
MSRSREPTSLERSVSNGAVELRNYRLIKRISQEELATVYQARHLTLDRPVQVHLLRRHDWISSSRFQLAARLAAQLNHPNLVPVIDAGHDEKYGDYLVTPQLDAVSLSTLLADGPLKPVLAMRIITQLAAALDYLHQQQIFHRDVQPANIVVTSEGVAYLANLSLAASPDSPDLSSIDEADYLTPYSAPEQRLTQGEAGAALDVYSFGAVAYHMLSGEIPPAPGQPLPSLARHDPGLSTADRVVQRMLAPQPGTRFAEAGIAAAALRQALRHQLDQATADMEESRWETIAEWLENPVETALGATLDEPFRDFLSRSRKRADDLHRHNAIRHRLTRWSRGGFFRRYPLGQLIVPDQIVSYNVYFYQLLALYETRTSPQAHTRMATPDDRNANLTPAMVWDAPIPEVEPFTGQNPQQLALPDSTRIVPCPECRASQYIPCPNCGGQGIIEKVRKVSTPTNRTSEERLTEKCQACHGYGRQPCPKCAGQGSLVEEQVFQWSRRAKLFNNTDDLTDLPVRFVQNERELIFEHEINPYEGRWHSVAPLAELLRTAIDEAGEETRLIGAKLTIQGATLTEIDLTLDEKPQRLYLIGFNEQLSLGWAFYNVERILLAALTVILLLLTVGAFALVWVG